MAAAMDAWFSRRRCRRLSRSRCWWVTTMTAKMETTMISKRIRAAMSCPRIVLGLGNFIVCASRAWRRKGSDSCERAGRELLFQILGDDDASEVDAGNIAFERPWVAGRAAIFAFDADAERLDEFKVGEVAGHGKKEIVGNHTGSPRRFQGR